MIDPHYFDWNSTTPPAPEVLDAMRDAEREFWGNSASVHAQGRKARAVAEEAREVLAREFAIHPRDVLFTSGGTEANNLALSGTGPLITNQLEHPSVVRVAEKAQADGRAVTFLNVEPSGVISPEALERALADLGDRAKSATVTLIGANHETGVIQPLAMLIPLCKRYGARVHVDAVQWVGKLGLSELSLADSIAIGAHKFRGPKGVGALLFRGTSPKPVLLGGAQERGLRPGTLNVALIVGLRVAFERARTGPARYAALAPLRDAFERALAPHAAVNGAGERLPHVSNLSFLGYPGPELVAALDLAGFCVSSGSACSAGTSEPSPVVAAMGGRERATSALRVSLGEEHDANAVNLLIKAIFRALSV